MQKYYKQLFRSEKMSFGRGLQLEAIQKTKEDIRVSLIKGWQKTFFSEKIQRKKILFKAVMWISVWIRICINLGPWIRICIPNADLDPEVYHEGKSRVQPTEVYFFFRRKLYFSSLNLKESAYYQCGITPLNHYNMQGILLRFSKECQEPQLAL